MILLTNIIYSDIESFNNKVRLLKSGGINSLHIIADFDNTISKAYNDKGEKFQSAIALIRHGGYLTPDYPKQAYELHDIYSPFENSTNYPIELRIQKMEEWWQKHLDLKIKCKMNRKVVNEIISKNPLPLRENIKEFFGLLKDNDVPVLIFSAGLGDIIEGILEINKINSSNVHLLTNIYKYNDLGFVTGYSGKIIHSLNKNVSIIKDTKYYTQIKQRKNLILLGDSLADPHMADGMEHDTVLTIGFYNNPDDSKIEEYKRHYDVLILNDGTMEFVIDTLRKILEK